MRKIGVMMLSASMMVGSCFGTVYAAGNKETTEAETIEEVEESEEDPDNDDPFSFEDFEWTIEEGIVDGKRAYVSHYVNNTDYDILQFSVDYVRNQEIEDDEVLDAFSDFRKENSGYWDDNEILDFELTVNNNHYTTAGSDSESTPVYYDGYWNPTSDKQFEVLTADIANIMYADSEKVYTVCYDLKNKKAFFNNDGKAIAKRSWSTCDFAKSLPEPDFDVILIDKEGSSLFSFTIYGAYVGDFEEYKNGCVDMGYKVDDASDSFFRGINDKKMKVVLRFSEDDNTIHGAVNVAD